MKNMFRNPRHTNKLKHGQEGGRPFTEDDEDDEDDNNTEQYDAAVADAMFRAMNEDDEDDDEAYRQSPSREEQAVQNIREFVTSPEITSIATMNLEQQRYLIQEEMDRVARDNIPVLRNSSDEGHRALARDFEQEYRRLLEQIEERIEASSTAPQPGGGLKMKEKIIKFERGPGKKKYTAYLKNNKTKKRRVLHFGHKDYQQFKDRTPNKLYSSKNHGDKHRQENYYNRHSGEKNRTKAIQKEIRKGKGLYTPKILSHKYLW